MFGYHIGDRCEGFVEPRFERFTRVFESEVRKLSVDALLLCSVPVVFGSELGGITQGDLCEADGVVRTYVPLCSPPCGFVWCK